MSLARTTDVTRGFSCSSGPPSRCQIAATPLRGLENWKPPRVISWPSSSSAGAPNQSGRGRENRHLKFYATRANLSKNTALPTSNRPAAPSSPRRHSRQGCCSPRDSAGDNRSERCLCRRERRAAQRGRRSTCSSPEAGSWSDRHPWSRRGDGVASLRSLSPRCERPSAGPARACCGRDPGVCRRAVGARKASASVQEQRLQERHRAHCGSGRKALPRAGV
jgi:hypothetical protein